jgi:hypothetical protein
MGLIDVVGDAAAWPQALTSTTKASMPPWEPVGLRIVLELIIILKANNNNILFLL